MQLQRNFRSARPFTPRLIMAAFTALLCTCATANAQFGEQTRITQQYRSAGGRSTTANILSNPTVSPYLAIADLNGTGIDVSQNYFTQVRPRVELQQNRQREQVQIQQLQQNMASLRSQSTRQNQTGPRITGHPTRFGYYLQYYPTLNRR